MGMCSYPDINYGFMKCSGGDRKTLISQLLLFWKLAAEGLILQPRAIINRQLFPETYSLAIITLCPCEMCQKWMG